MGKRSVQWAVNQRKRSQSLVTLYSSKNSIDVRQTHMDAVSAGLRVIEVQEKETRGTSN